jgi:hypothetical protein
MTNNIFELRLLDTHWIKGGDDPNDLCAHGHVFVKIGKEVISDIELLDVCVSAAALHLMRTINISYKKNDFASQLLPHCGHFIIPDESKTFSIIVGCPSGIDWTINHLQNDKVEHVSDNGQKALIDKEVYKNLVFQLADQIENFYKSSLPKNVSENDITKEGYEVFWKEWRKLRERS